MKWGYYRKERTAVNHSPMAAMSQHNISEDLEPADANNAIHLKREITPPTQEAWY
jgi:hypothetical protein